MTRQHTTRIHPELGELVYDEKVRWWTGRVSFGGREDVRLTVDAPLDVDDSLFAGAARALAAVDCEDLKSFAAARLYALYNRTWRSKDGPDVDEAGFRALLRPRTFSVQDDGAMSVTFDGGDLFAGHDVVVGLDALLRLRVAEIEG